MSYSNQTLQYADIKQLKSFWSSSDGTFLIIPLTTSTWRQVILTSLAWKSGVRRSNLLMMTNFKMLWKVGIYPGSYLLPNGVIFRCGSILRNTVYQHFHCLSHITSIWLPFLFILIHFLHTFPSCLLNRISKDVLHIIIGFFQSYLLFIILFQCWYL